MDFTKEEAKQLYPDAPELLKKKLEEEFGADFFEEKNYEKIKTFEDACASMGVTVSSVLSKNDTDDETAYKQLKVIVAAINEGWVPDWTNSDEYKYWPWFNMSSGSVFSHSLYDDCYTGTNVGSRLCLKDRERCIYAATQFKAIYERFFIIK